jgi:hypothetical protein
MMMDLELVCDVATAAATGQGWKFAGEVTMFEEKRWPLGPVACWRIEFTRIDRPAIGFVKVDARSLDVIATGWRADPRPIARRHHKHAERSLEEALLRAVA